MKALFAILLVGCASFNLGPSGNDDGGMGLSDGAAGGCMVSIAIKPMMPEAGDHVHAMAVVTNLDGVPTYNWTLDGSASTAYEALDDSAIGFDVPTAAMHTVDLTITGTTSYCPQAFLQVDVGAGSGAMALYRLRVVAPSDLAPPFETELLVRAGTPTPRDVALDPGEDLPGTVTSGTMGVPAYLEFVPSSGPPIETFSTMMTGAFDARVALVPYQVLVVPEIPGFAPRSFAWTPGSPASFAVDAGGPITGTVLAPGGGPLANAQVQLASNGVPSTIATTAADGSFTILASFAAGSSVSVSVIPPASSGLARLAATTTLAQPLAISYNAATPCDLAGAAVQRSGVAQPGAQVTIVGTVGIAGMIGNTFATGTVNVTATTTGSGVLPSTPVPRASLSAIVEVAAGDLAVATLDTSTCAAQTIVAPPPVANTGVVVAGTTPLPNARVEATPTGTLALATLVPIDAMTAADGSFTLPLASGASYDIRVNDLRGAPFEVPDVTMAPTSIVLGAALAIDGTVSVLGGASNVAGAAVELLCASCTGVDADRPITQTASDVQGHYELSVADPGSM